MDVDPNPAQARLFPATTATPPGWLLGAKACLLGLLVVGAAFPQVGGFAGKGMLFRLPLFFAPSLILPLHWLARRRRPRDATEPLRYQAALDAGLTLPFLADTAANAVGLYDSFDPTDNYLHLINWFILFGGVACALSTSVSRDVPTWLLVAAAGGIGATGAIGWEIAEYRVMLAGPANLHLTYPDTLSDLALSSSGGFLGAAAALWAIGRLRPAPATIDRPAVWELPTPDGRDSNKRMTSPTVKQQAPALERPAPAPNLSEANRAPKEGDGPLPQSEFPV